MGVTRNSTLKLAVVVAAILLVLAGCVHPASEGEATDNGGSGSEDTTAPTLLSTRPLPGAVGVALNTSLLLTFSEAMDDASTTAALAVTYPDGGGAPVPVTGAGTWGGEGRILTYQGEAAWLPETVYTVRLAATAADLAGNPLGTEAVFSFTTGLLPDTLAPRVTYVRPADGAGGQALNLPVVLGFSEPMELASVEAAFVLALEGTPVPGSAGWTSGGQVLTFTPEALLSGDSTYTVTLAATATDLAGNALTGPFTASFGTGSGTATTTEIGEGITGTDLDGDGVIDEYTLDLNVLTAEDLQSAIDNGDFEGTLVLTSEPPVEFEVPLFINRDGVQIQVLPAQAVTLDGEGVIESIVHVGGDNVVVDGLAVTGGMQDLITQTLDAYGDPIPVSGLVLRNLVVTGSANDDCIQLKDCQDCLIEHVTAYNCYSHGISTTGCGNIVVRNVTIGCQDEPGCMYGAYSNTGFLHFFKTDGVTVQDVEIFASVRRPGGPATGGFAVKLEQNSGHLLLERLTVHDNFPAVAPAGLDDGGPGDAVLGVVDHQTDAPDGSVTVRDSTFADNNAPALYFSILTGVQPTISVEGLVSSGNTGLVGTDGEAACDISGSTITETGVSDVLPCTGSGNTFPP